MRGRSHVLVVTSRGSGRRRRIAGCILTDRGYGLGVSYVASGTLASVNLPDCNEVFRLHLRPSIEQTEEELDRTTKPLRRI